MSIRNGKELAVSREKLRLLEERVAALKGQTDGDAHVRELSLRSLKSMVISSSKRSLAIRRGLWCHWRADGPVPSIPESSRMGATGIFQVEPRRVPDCRAAQESATSGDVQSQR